ncbi:MAG TPA: recombinase family protein [Bosea sp. (in: a-proteobacteria)]
MAQDKGSAKAFGYIRTSSATNAGSDKDSEKRQRVAVEAYAHAQGIDIADWYCDPAVSGADPVESRPGFADMLDRLMSNGVRTIIVENSSRFARDLMVQEIGYRLLIERGIALIAADSPASFTDDTPTASLIRQVLGAVAQFEKSMLVAKLRGARDRKSREMGRRIEGGAGGIDAALGAKIKRLTKTRSGKARSLREIATELQRLGVVNPVTGRPYTHAGVAKALKRAATD